MTTSSAIPPPSRPCQRVIAGPVSGPGFPPAGGPADPGAGRPGGDPQAPQAHESLSVLVAEGVAGVVGGQAVVVEGHRAAPADHGGRPRRLEPQAHLAGDVALGLDDERVEGLLER